MSGPPIGVFSLFRLPLGAFRPNDLMYVYEQDGRIAGLVRVEREAARDEWTIVSWTPSAWPMRATSATASSTSCCARPGSAAPPRFHVACADTDGNVELLMQAGFHPLRRGAVENTRN